jgi:acid phosphatase family membrane protein YuiD
LIETGGMPSSHSALMTGCASGIGWQLGFADPLFALAATLCFVVLYDASGVRRAAGNTAARVNTLADAELAPLKENLGHTRLEVLVGSLIGPAVALPGLALVGSPLQLAISWGWLPPLG